MNLIRILMASQGLISTHQHYNLIIRGYPSFSTPANAFITTPLMQIYRFFRSKQTLNMDCARCKKYYKTYK